MSELEESKCLDDKHGKCRLSVNVSSVDLVVFRGTRHAAMGVPTITVRVYVCFYECNITFKYRCHLKRCRLNETYFLNY